MATNQIDSRSSIDAPVAGFSVTDIAQAIVMPLASLRFTVALLFLAILMTWVATLEQAYDDVFNVKMRHFSSVLVEVPVQVFFPPAWAPSLQNVPGKIFLPSGVSILVLMMVNLTAAHSLRFKVQACGTRLVVGVIALLVAILIAGVVVLNGQGAGVQTDPFIPYTQMWFVMLAAVLVMAVGAIVAAFVLSLRKIEHVLLLYLGLMGVIAALVLFVFNQAYIGDSAMRIMWQLVQAAIAAVSGFVACVFLFKRKAGMVLLHIGVMGLMLNEILVTTGHREHRLSLFEGETKSEVIDIRFHEMAIVDVSDPKVDRIVTVPAQKLANLEKISSPELPFDIRCVQYLRNSVVTTSGGAQINKLATAGVGQFIGIKEVPTVAGTNSDQEIDVPAAYVELTGKETGESLGIYALVHSLNSQARIGFANRVAVNGKDYHVLLRFETFNKPYKITLDDATREDYPGSDTPKHYGSKITINDQRSGEVTEQEIKMNNPLRYGGDTFYQSGMPDVGPGQPRLSIFQVVTNVGWMIPYLCCMYTVVGLLGQFMLSLLSYLEKQLQPVSKPVPVAALAEDDLVPAGKVELLPPPASAKPVSTRSPVLWLPAVLLVGLIGSWVAMKFGEASKQVTHNEMRMDLLGQIPVTFEGRVQPLDSFARNTLRQLRQRETVTDGNGDSQPAIVWLADVMFDAEAGKDYATFYMTDPNVKNALDLPSPKTVKVKRKQYVYTVDEILSRTDEMRKLIPNPKKVDEENWTPLQRKLELLRRQANLLKGAQFVFGPPKQKSVLDDMEALWTIRGSTGVPFAVPSDDRKKPWVSMVEAVWPTWISSVADGAKTVDVVAEKISQESWSDNDLLEMGLLNAMNKPEFQQAMTTLDREELRRVLIAKERIARNKVLVSILTKLNDGNREIADEVSVSENLALLMKLKPAYLAGDAETFNQTLEAYLASVKQEPPTFYSSVCNRLELVYNVASPFYLTISIYILSFLMAVLSWCFIPLPRWRVSVGRIAMGLLLLGLLVHTIGIVMRIGISGRPPVTNLYSSVLFVSAAGIVIALLMELFTRMSIGTFLGALSGTGGLLWAHSMTVVDGDTFTVMVAVLDTTFWLATHVVMISLGYAATFMAGLIGLVFLMMWFFTPAFNDKKTKRLFANVLYGVVCFGLLASFFGTVLGGLWGDDSWGRFWGWDPKENGALMIVLWNALILHARWGGLVKERGVAALAVLGNIIVLWSWKGVNLLGVGLHAYAASEDTTIKWILLVGLFHVVIACFALLPAKFQLFGEQA